MKAILNENKVVQILTPINGFDLEDCFHKDLLKSAIEVPDYVSSGCTLQDDGTWLDAEGVLIEASVVEEPVVEEPAEAPAEEPAEEPAEQPAEEPAEAPAEEPAEAPAE